MRSGLGRHDSHVASTAAGIERTGPAVRAALAGLAPSKCARFEADFRRALAASHDDFDAERVQDVIGRWWARALVLARPDPAVDAAWERIKAGATSDLVEEWRAQQDGSQHVYRKAANGDWVFTHTRQLHQ